MAVDDTDPVLLFELAKSEAPEVCDAMKDRYPSGYGVGFLGATGVGKSSTCNICAGQQFSTVGSGGISTTLYPCFFEKVPGVLRFVDMPGFDDDLYRFFVDYPRPDKLAQTVARAGDAATPDDKAAADAFKNMREVFKHLKSGQYRPGMPISWLDGKPWDEESMEPTEWADADLGGEVHAIVVTSSLLNIPAELLRVSGPKGGFTCELTDARGAPTALVKLCNEVSSLYTHCKVSFKENTFIFFTGLDFLQDSVHLVDGGATLGLHEDRLAFMKEKIAELCNAKHKTFFLNAKAGHEAPLDCRRHASEQLFKVLQAVDKEQVKACQADLRREGY